MPSLSFELSTLAACGGTRTTRWGTSADCKGSQTRAGRFRFSMDNSASNLWVFVSRSGNWPSRLPIETSAWNKHLF